MKFLQKVSFTSLKIKSGSYKIFDEELVGLIFIESS